MLRRLLAAATLALAASGCGTLDRIREHSRWQMQAGYEFGSTSQGTFVAASHSVGAACNVNDLYGFSKDYGELEVGIRAVDKVIFSPQRGYALGATPFFTYTYPLGDFGLYVEGGAGPGYLSIQTREQGNPGFNFIDQAGGGVRYQPIDHLTIRAGYQYTHISHAGLRESRNRGLDLHAILLGLELRF